MGVKNPGLTPNPRWADDHRLSAPGLGLITYVASRPTGWVCKTDDLKARFSLGRDAFRTITRHLEELGYLTRQATKGTGGLWTGSSWVLQDPFREGPAEPRTDGVTENPSLISRKTSGPQKPSGQKNTPQLNSRPARSADAAEPQEKAPRTKLDPAVRVQAARVAAACPRVRNSWGPARLITRAVAEYDLPAEEVADLLITLGTNGRGVSWKNLAAAVEDSTAATAPDMPAALVGRMTPQEWRVGQLVESLRLDLPDMDVALAALETAALTTGLALHHGTVRTWDQELATVSGITAQEAQDAVRELAADGRALRPAEVVAQVRRARRAARLQAPEAPAASLAPAPERVSWVERAQQDPEPEAWCPPPESFRAARQRIREAREARLAAGALI